MNRRYRGSKDHNHDEVRDAFSALGCSVADLHNAGVPGWPDIVVGCIGVNHLVEVKNLDTRYGRAGLNPEQAAFARDWRGGPVEVAYTPEDAIALVSRWRKDPYLRLPPRATPPTPEP